MPLCLRWVSYFGFRFAYWIARNSLRLNVMEIAGYGTLTITYIFYHWSANLVSEHSEQSQYGARLCTFIT